MDQDNKATLGSDDSSQLNVSVTVILDTSIIKGVSIFHQKQRITDALNKGKLGLMQKEDKDFIALDNAVVFNLRGEKTLETYQILVSKNSILLVVESEGINSSLEVSPGTAVKMYPVREKKQIPVIAKFSFFDIEGIMHAEQMHKLSLALDQEIVFLPITGIVFKPPLTADIRTARFASMNKQRVQYISERQEK